MYELELDRVISVIKKNKHKRVLIQLPDGLKPKAAEIAEATEEKTSAKAYIWFSSCFGACDIPSGLDSLGIDALVQFGHNKFIKKNW